MARILIAVVLLTLTAAPAPAAFFDFAPYARLLDRYLSQGEVAGIPAALVDYDRWQREQAAPGSDWRALLGALAAFDPATLATHDERLAFWINAYNIGAIKTILDHWPVDSIRSRKIHWLGLPWKREVLVVGGRAYSLYEIEFDQLVVGLKDLRAHLGVNCASASCVDLRAEPYVPARVAQQLQEQGERFFASPEKGLRLDREAGVVWVSQVFKFDREHFDAYAGGAIPFLLPYVDAATRAALERGDLRLEYLDYDWSLNNGPGKP